MPRFSLRPNLSHLLPLPGVGELEGSIRGLVDALKASGFEKERYQSLVTHLESLLDIVRPASQVEGFEELLSQLCNVKNRVEAQLKPKSRMNLLRAEDQLELLDSLNREVDRMLMRFQLKLLAQSSLLSTSQNRRSGIENMKVIPSDEILPLEETWSISCRQLSRGRRLGHAYEMRTEEGDQVMISQRSGRYNNLRVVYQTYGSSSDDAAAKQAEMDLMVLSKLLHENIANVVGVTKGYYGLNGIVVQIETKAGRLPEEFLSQTMSGAALVRYIRGVHSVFEFLMDEDRNMSKAESLTVQSNGHLIVVPSARDEDEWGVNPFRLLRTQRETNSGLSLVLRHQFLRDDSYQFGGPNDVEAREFLDKINKLSSTSLSELSVLKAASDAGISALYKYRRFELPAAPSFTIMPGDIGCLVKHKGVRSWEVLHNGGTPKSGVTASNISVRPWRSACDEGCKWTRYPSTSVEFSTWVAHCPHGVEWIELELNGSNLTWKDMMQRAKDTSDMHGIRTHKLSFCKSVDFSIQRVSTGIIPEGPTYFHINQRQRSNPQEFWGFFSSSSDPHMSSARLEAPGWTFTYEIGAYFYDIKDDFGRRYEAALNKGLANMPGGYPGGSVEEISDDEVSDEEESDDEAYQV